MSLATKHEVRTAIVESRSLCGRAAQSLLAGLRANPGGPRLLWLGGRRADVTTFELDRHGLCRVPDSTVPLDTARRGHILEPAELIALLSPEDGVRLRPDEIGAASLVVLDHVDTGAGRRLHKQFAADDQFVLLAHEQANGMTYSVFEKTGSAVARNVNSEMSSCSRSIR